MDIIFHLLLVYLKFALYVEPRLHHHRQPLIGHRDRHEDREGSLQLSPASRLMCG